LYISSKSPSYLTAKYNKILQRIQSEEKSSELKAEVVSYRKEIAKLISEIEVKRAEIVKIQTQIDQSSEGYGDEDEEGKQFKEKVKASKKVSVDIKADYNTAYKKATEISTIDYEEELNKQEINTRINSEAKLKDLLTKKDSDLLNYLKANGVNLAESDIREIVTRIINKHAEGKTATAYSKNLKNTKVHDALVMGQLFITKVETNELNVDDGVGV